MKHLKLIAAGIALSIVPLLAMVHIADAQTFSAHVDKNKVIDSSLYSAGQNVDIAGTINGDVYCAGQNVTVDATVNGDVMCAGQTVIIKGRVNGDVRVAGQTVTIDADVTRSLTAAGQTVTLESGARVGRDATVTGSALNLKGNVARDAVLGGSQADLSGKISRNVRFGGESLALKPGAVVGGSLNYTSDRKAAISATAKVNGTVHQTKPQHEQDNGTPWTLATGFFVWVFLSLLFFSMIVALAFPQLLHRVSRVAEHQWGAALLTGLVLSFVMPFVLIMLVLTGVGIPLALVLLLTWVLLMALSGPVAGYSLGRKILSRSNNPLLIMLVGGVALIILYFIPFIGFIIMMLALWLGTGAILLAAKRNLPAPKYKIE